jgi:hypothetical protein
MYTERRRQLRSKSLQSVSKLVFYAHIVHIVIPFGSYWQSGYYEIATIYTALVVSMQGAILIKLFLLMYDLTLIDENKTSYEWYLKAVWWVYVACLVVIVSLMLWTLRTPAFDFWLILFGCSSIGFIISVGFLAISAMDDVLRKGQGVLPDKVIIHLSSCSSC